MPISYTAFGNCNVTYIGGVALYKDKPKEALHDALSIYINNKAMYRDPYPITIFTQGSEHDIVQNPYARQIKKFIEQEGLGTITEIGPVPSPLHQNKPTYLFVWVTDRAACRAWWKKNFEKPVVSNAIEGHTHEIRF